MKKVRLRQACRDALFRDSGVLNMYVTEYSFREKLFSRFPVPAWR